MVFEDSSVPSLNLQISICSICTAFIKPVRVRVLIWDHGNFIPLPPTKGGKTDPTSAVVRDRA